MAVIESLPTLLVAFSPTRQALFSSAYLCELCALSFANSVLILISLALSQTVRPHPYLGTSTPLNLLAVMPAERPQGIGPLYVSDSQFASQNCIFSQPQWKSPCPMPCFSVASSFRPLCPLC